jgi:hypothetical protein
MRRESFYFTILILTAVLFWAWGPALSVGFLADDYEWFNHVADIPWSQVWKLFWYPALEAIKFVRYRPLVGLWFWSDYQIWGYFPMGYHLTNLMMHALAVVGVYIFTFLMLSKNSSDISRKRGRLVGLTAASLFSVNPLLAEAVTWVDGRYDVIASGFFIWSLVFLTQALQKRKRKLLVGTFVLVCFSLLAKETGVIFPAVLVSIIIYIDIYSRSNIDMYRVKNIFKKRINLIISSIGLILGFLVLSYLVLGKSFWFAGGNYSLGVSKPFVVWLVITGSIYFFSLIRKKKIIGKFGFFAWLLIGISLLPVALFPTQLRFLYLPMAFFSMALAFFIYEVIFVRSKLGLIVTWSLLFILASFVLRHRNQSWIAASNFHQRVVGEIGQVVMRDKPQLLYVFNLPDSIRGIPVFRSYVREAVILSLPPSAFSSVKDVKFIIGPTSVDLGKSSFQVTNGNEAMFENSSGFLLFEPTVVERLADGSLLVDWAGEWTANYSSDRREVQVLLPHKLDEEGVMGLVLDKGEMVNITLEEGVDEGSNG